MERPEKGVPFLVRLGQVEGQLGEGGRGHDTGAPVFVPGDLTLRDSGPFGQLSLRESAPLAQDSEELR